MTTDEFSPNNISAKPINVEASRILKDASVTSYETATQAGGVSTFEIFNKKVITITNAN